MQTQVQPHTHVPVHTGRIFRALSEVVEVKLGAEHTDGKYSVLAVTVPSMGGAPILHTHPPQETFYVVEGTFAILGLGDDGPYTITASAGSVVHIPAGAPHGYQNVGETVGRLVLVFEPAGIMERFLEEISTPVSDPSAPPPPAEPIDLERILPYMQKYNVALALQP
jgi:quercetin dioxygenase-like cupin family protein